MVVRNLKHEGKKILMVGDGINDSPSLATADIGVAIGSGSDIAIESADIILLKPNLGGIIELIYISKKTYQNIKQNLFWALGYNSLGIPLAFLGILPPWVSGMAMAFSSLTVVVNALRLQKLIVTTKKT